MRNQKHQPKSPAREELGRADGVMYWVSLPFTIPVFIICFIGFAFYHNIIHLIDLIVGPDKAASGSPGEGQQTGTQTLNMETMENQNLANGDGDA